MMSKPSIESDDVCMDKYTNSLCNGRGTCECNDEGKTCNCDAGYNGKYCQNVIKSDKNDETCQRLAPCILKDIFKNATEYQVDIDYLEFKNVLS